MRRVGKGQHAAKLRGSSKGERAAGGILCFPWKELPCRCTFCGQALPDPACLSPS
jgi:hypothetical protein